MELYEAIKTASVLAVEAQQPSDIYIGTVKSVNPLEIQMSPKLILTPVVLKIAKRVADYGLAVGDQLLMSREWGGQRYYVYDKLADEKEIITQNIVSPETPVFTVGEEFDPNSKLMPYILPHMGNNLRTSSVAEIIWEFVHNNVLEWIADNKVRVKNSGIVELIGKIKDKKINVSINCKVKEAEYTITYDANGGENAPKPQIKVHNQPLTVTETIPTREGYEFLGWELNSQSTLVSYRPGGTLSLNLSLTLYAVWKKRGGMGEYNGTLRTTDGFAGWYYPDSDNRGIVGPLPRFVQMNWGPCLGYCIMMGDYYLRFKDIDVNEFFNNRFVASYGNGAPYLIGNYANWVNVSKNNYGSEFEALRPVLIKELNEGRPVVVPGNDGSSDHFVLVVSYIGEGVTKSDFIVIDPLYEYNDKLVTCPTTYEDFRSEFGNDTVYCPSLNPVYLFN